MEISELSLKTDLTKQIFDDAYPQWKLVKKIGKGNFSEVYLVEDEFAFNEEEELVALNVIDSKKFSNPTVIRKIVADAKEEGRKQVSLQRQFGKKGFDGIVRVFGGHIIKGLPVIRMEYLKKGSLNDNLKNLSAQERIDIYAKVCKIIHVLNKRKIFHRDIKPQNILLTEMNEPKLADFGLALDIREKIDSVGGTLYYMAPEALKGIVNVKTEVYSLGILGYQLFTGFLPHDKTTIIKKLHRQESYNESFAKSVANSALITIDEVSIPEKIKAAIKIAIQPDPKKRKTTALELHNLLIKASYSSYLTSLNSLKINNGVVEKYSGPCSFRPENGMKIFFCEIKKFNNEYKIIISHYGIIEKSRKNRTNRNYNIFIENNKLIKLKKPITLQDNDAILFNLKTYYNKIKKAGSQLNFLHKISWDAFDFIKKKGNFVV